MSGYKNLLHKIDEQRTSKEIFKSTRVQRPRWAGRQLQKQTDQVPLMSLGGQNTAKELTTTATEGGLGKQAQPVIIE